MIWLLLLSPKSCDSGLLPQFCNPLIGWEGVVQAACNSLKFWAPWRLCNSSCPCLQTPGPFCVCFTPCLQATEPAALLTEPWEGLGMVPFSSCSSAFQFEHCHLSVCKTCSPEKAPSLPALGGLVPATKS